MSESCLTNVIGLMKTDHVILCIVSGLSLTILRGSVTPLQFDRGELGRSVIGVYMTGGAETILIGVGSLLGNVSTLCDPCPISSNKQLVKK